VSGAIETLRYARELLARYGHNPAEASYGGCQLAGFSLYGALSRAAGRPWLGRRLPEDWQEVETWARLDRATVYVLAVLGLREDAPSRTRIELDRAAAPDGRHLGTGWAVAVLREAEHLASREVLRAPTLLMRQLPTRRPRRRGLLGLRAA
jgi:hypothetical protein